jgi:hypothetical protein
MRSSKERQRALARQYFANERKLLTDWYREYYTLDIHPGELCSSVPRVGEMRKSLSKWLERERSRLFNLICVEWDYRSIRRNRNAQDAIGLAVWLADTVFSKSQGIPSPTAIAVILVQRGLDKFCGCT